MFRVIRSWVVPSSEIDGASNAAVSLAMSLSCSVSCNWPGAAFALVASSVTTRSLASTVWFGTVVAVKSCSDCPAGIVTVAGTCSRALSDDVRFSVSAPVVSPFLAAVTVMTVGPPVVVEVPVSSMNVALAAVRVNVCTSSSVTVMTTVASLRSVAEALTVTAVLPSMAESFIALIATLADVCPARIVTLVCASESLL